MTAADERAREAARWRSSVVLYVVAIVSALWVAPSGPIYWDSYGYVEQALVGKVGGLALGRPLFVLVSHAIARAFLALGGSPWRLERVLAIAWLSVAALAAPFAAMLARRLGLGPRGAMVAGLAIALSPIAAHTSAAVLTEGPSLALALLALVVALHVRARPLQALGAGAILGAAFAVREQAIWALVPLVFFVARSSVGEGSRRAVAILCALLGATFVAGFLIAWFANEQAGWFDRFPIWFGGMARERESHRLGLQDIVVNIGWVAALGPATLLLAAIGLGLGRRELLHPRASLFPLVAIGLVLVASLLTYPDLATHPRYMLHALPAALAFPAAWAIEKVPWLQRRPLTLVAVLFAVPTIAARPIVGPRQERVIAACEEIRERLTTGPSERPTVLVTGQPCAALRMYRVIARYDPNARPGLEIEAICAGWGWPRDLDARLEAEIETGHTIVVDLREGAWTTSQVAERRELEAWFARRGEPSTAVIALK